jgi:hypothetical protein
MGFLRRNREELPFRFEQDLDQLIEQDADDKAHKKAVGMIHNLFDAPRSDSKSARSTEGNTAGPSCDSANTHKRRPWL